MCPANGERRATVPEFLRLAVPKKVKTAAEGLRAF